MMTNKPKKCPRSFHLVKPCFLGVVVMVALGFSLFLLFPIVSGGMSDWLVVRKWEAPDWNLIGDEPVRMFYTAGKPRFVPSNSLFHCVISRYRNNEMRRGKARRVRVCVRQPTALKLDSQVHRHSAGLATSALGR